MKQYLKRKLLNINTQPNYWADCWLYFIDGEDSSSKRQSRGRKLCINNSIIDLMIQQGSIKSPVKGTTKDTYHVKIDVPPFIKWNIVNMCQRFGINYSSLISGNIPRRMKNNICNTDYGIFSIRRKMKLSCTCPDHLSGSYICKHIYASLYKTGQEIQKKPELFFLIFQINIDNLQNLSSDKRLFPIKKVSKKD